MTPAALPAGQSRPSTPAKSPPAARRLVLVPSASGRDDEHVRRYRLARLRLEPREVPYEERFAHLTHRHD